MSDSPDPNHKSFDELARELGLDFDKPLAEDSLIGPGCFLRDLPPEAAKAVEDLLAKQRTHRGPRSGILGPGGLIAGDEREKYTVSEQITAFFNGDQVPDLEIDENDEQVMRTEPSFPQIKPPRDF